jgi:hypothetical protein
MSMAEPFLPHPERDQEIAAADPGAGAPAPAPGFGIGGEDPDVSEGADEAETGAPDHSTPFRTPEGEAVPRERIEQDTPPE